jgi:hypothetical protein
MDKMALHVRGTPCSALKKKEKKEWLFHDIGFSIHVHTVRDKIKTR